MDIITTAPAYLTASYLSCAKWIGFTVQMCMGVFSLCPCTYCPRPLLECVCQRPFLFCFFLFFKLRASTVLSCFAGLLLSPGIDYFHNFQSQCCVLRKGPCKLLLVETTLLV